MWIKLLINILISFAGGFGAVYSISGDIKQGLYGGVSAIVGNQVGLHQAPPSKGA